MMPYDDDLPSDGELNRDYPYRLNQQGRTRMPAPDSINPDLTGRPALQGGSTGYTGSLGPSGPQPQSYYSPLNNGMPGAPPLGPQSSIAPGATPGTPSQLGGLLPGVPPQGMSMPQLMQLIQALQARGGMGMPPIAGVSQAPSAPQPSGPYQGQPSGGPMNVPPGYSYPLNLGIRG